MKPTHSPKFTKFSLKSWKISKLYSSRVIPDVYRIYIYIYIYTQYRHPVTKMSPHQGPLASSQIFLGPKGPARVPSGWGGVRRRSHSCTVWVRNMRNSAGLHGIKHESLTESFILVHMIHMIHMYSYVMFAWLVKDPQVETLKTCYHSGSVFTGSFSHQELLWHQPRPDTLLGLQKRRCSYDSYEFHRMVGWFWYVLMKLMKWMKLMKFDEWVLIWKYLSLWVTSSQWIPGSYRVRMVCVGHSPSLPQCLGEVHALWKSSDWEDADETGMNIEGWIGRSSLAFNII